MKIIKSDITFQPWNHPHTCEGCHSELEVEFWDVKARYLPMVKKCVFEANCPICNFKFMIPVGEIPEIIQQTAMNKEVLDR